LVALELGASPQPERTKAPAEAGEKAQHPVEVDQQAADESAPAACEASPRHAVAPAHESEMTASAVRLTRASRQPGAPLKWRTLVLRPPDQFPFVLWRGHGPSVRHRCRTILARRHHLDNGAGSDPRRDRQPNWNAFSSPRHRVPVTTQGPHEKVPPAV
jgi:hypothetical protein